MTTKIKSSILALTAMATLLVAGPASAQGYRYHPGWHRYHVYRGGHWGYVYHPAGWVVPPAWVGPSVSVGVGPAVAVGWGYHPGWHRYHVYRNGSWGYVYHPVGWAVPAAWAGPGVAYHGYHSYHGYHGYHGHAQWRRHG